MKLKVVSTAILAFGISIPLTGIAATQSQDQSTQAATGSSIPCNCGSQELALSQPNQSDSAILAWANSTAVATFTYNYADYRGAIQNLSGFFTDGGWSQFEKSLNDSHNLDAVQSKKIVVSAVATKPPIILKKGVLNNAYSWEIQLPMLVMYQSPTQYSKKNVIITMTIVRTSSVNAPRGMAINQYIVSPDDTSNKNVEQKSSQ